ncbi:RHS repeat-associated core domain-containing protein [Pseudescherichia sp.]|uniref:RHS repeat-associated core domain-containing protein n=1 Tax=Pseudescherichia sp. TaxID=2055881 RepID=UPI00289D7FA5|nr:RHS repeat-associated core domain-containing protein [Pseudescherichia sp.]
MSLQLLGTNQTNSTLLAYDGSSQQISLYSAFGAVDNPKNDQLPGFNGERQDPLTGVSHLGNGYRSYNPILMRFTCPDSESPFGVGGINPYAYCQNDPVNFTDPSGHGILTRLFIGGLTSLFKHLFAAETSEALATVLVKTTRGALTYGTQVTKNVVDIAARIEENSNPQVFAKLQNASFGLGIINGVTSLYSSFENIIDSTSSLEGHRGSVDLSYEFESESRFGNRIRDMLLRAADRVAEATNTSSDDLSIVFIDTFNSFIGSEAREGALMGIERSRTKIIYQLINSSFAVSSTVLAIASKAVEAKNPDVARKLSRASSALGYTNLGLSFGGNINAFYNDLKEVKPHLGTIREHASTSISSTLNSIFYKHPSLGNLTSSNA